MSQTEKNKSIVRRFLAEMDKKNWLIFQDLMAPEYVFHMPGNPEPFSRDQHAETAQLFYQAFPDLVHHVEDAIAENDRVAARIRITGTHRGDFMGTPATDRSITFSSTFIAQFNNEKMVAAWGEVDFAGLMQQITEETTAAV